MTDLDVLVEEAGRDFAGLGALGRELVAVLDVVTATAGDRGVAVLVDPGFALETLTAAGPRCETAAIGRVLDYLRDRAGTSTSGSATRRTVTVAEAVAAYEAGPLSLLAAGTGHTYRTWTRRLVAQAADADVATVTTGDLTDVIARFAAGGRDRRGRSRASEGNAVAAYRNLWAYLVEKGYARANVAARLRKPARGEPRRRPFRPEEAALVRQLARLGHDPLLDEVTVTLAERLGLRRIEICRLRLCDVDLGRAEAKVWGKADKDRLMPLPPGLVELLGLYMEDRRPASCQSAAWSQRGDVLLRRRPTPTWPEGRPTGRRRIEELFARLGRAHSDLGRRRSSGTSLVGLAGVALRARNDHKTEVEARSEVGMQPTRRPEGKLSRGRLSPTLFARLPGADGAPIEKWVSKGLDDGERLFEGRRTRKQ